MPDCGTTDDENANRRTSALPLPGGEGWGEGEHSFSVHFRSRRRTLDSPEKSASRRRLRDRESARRKPDTDRTFRRARVAGNQESRTALSSMPSRGASAAGVYITYLVRNDTVAECVSAPLAPVTVKV